MGQHFLQIEGIDLEGNRGAGDAHCWMMDKQKSYRILQG